LHALGSIFGRPLQTDQATAARTRPSVARVLVEVDISKKHSKEVWVGSKAYGYLQKVELEKVSEFCNHCKMHGHAQVDCFKLNPELKKSAISNNGNPGPTENKQVYVLVHDNKEGNITSVEPPPSPLAQVEEIDTLTDNGKGEVGNLDMPVDVLNTSNDVILDSTTDISKTDPKLFILIDDMLNDMPTISNSVAIENVLLSRQDLDQTNKDGEEVDYEHYEEGEIVPPSKTGNESPYKHGTVSSSIAKKSKEDYLITEEEFSMK
ncbi:uncharacterized protein LOC110115999, partial [Dendrobium catenatum]|uniref:uncharacterized protein LOC110115999 n=1 Tax=Dendrobium catenatum TaxID=906689 RepID=UPI0010A016AB